MSFYSEKKDQLLDQVPVAWLDSEGSPCIVISKNLKEFLSLLPYGMGFIYTVAAAIENNLDDPELLEKVNQRIGKSSGELLEAAKIRFLDIEQLIDWLNSKNIKLNKDPISLIINAHTLNNELTNGLLII